MWTARRRLPLLALAALVVVGCGGSKQKAGPEIPGAKVAESKQVGTVTVQRIVYTSFDGSKVPALMSIPLGAPPRGCLIWENGLGSRKENVSPLWDGAGRLGLALFSIDLRDHGERATSPDELAQAVRSPAQLEALVRGTIGDLKSAVGYLEQRPECHHNVAYAGLSLGGMIGSVLTAQDTRIRAVVLMSTPPSWRSLIMATDQILPGIEHNPEALQAALRDLSPLDPDRWVGRISPRPLLLMIGRDDPLVPPAAARKIEASAREPKAVLNYTGSHIPLTGQAASTNAGRIAGFLLKHVVEPTYAGQ